MDGTAQLVSSIYKDAYPGWVPNVNMFISFNDSIFMLAHRQIALYDRDYCKLNEGLYYDQLHYKDSLTNAQDIF